MIRFTLRDKTPDEEDVRSIDWSKHIGVDTLVGAPTSLVREGTVVVNNLTNPDTHTTNFWVRGGIRGEVARFLVHAETTAGRKLEAECVIGVR